MIFLVMRTQDYSLNFHMEHTTVSIIFLMLYIPSLVLIYLITESSYKLLTVFLQSPLPAPLRDIISEYEYRNIYRQMTFFVFDCVVHHVGILVPPPGIEPMLLTLVVQSLSTREVLPSYLKKKNFKFYIGVNRLTIL